MIITISGEPKGKGRPRFTRSGRAYTPAETRNYEKHIRTSYLNQTNEQMYAEEPLNVVITAFYGLPKSLPKYKVQMAINGEITPTKKPDIDNIAKAVLDGLNGLAYADDKQIVSLHVYKRYVTNEAQEPRVVVEIKEDKR